jgi:hypothetical protein
MESCGSFDLFKDIDHFFIYLLAIYTSLANCSVHLPTYGLDYLYFCVFISLYILDINHHQMNSLQRFSAIL